MDNLPLFGLIGQSYEQLHRLIEEAIEAAVAKGVLPQPAAENFEFGIEIPADSAHGDFSSNAAMAGAKQFRRSPRTIAEAVLANLSLDGTPFSHAQIAGPGFINFFAKQSWYSQAVNEILAQGSRYGRTGFGKNKRIMVEFVSANPTGPMHMGNARGGAIGDCLAAVLEHAGYDVAREFYINDAGNQIEKFALSLESRYLQHFLGSEAPAFPEDGYHGVDITARAEEYIAQFGDRLLGLAPQERKNALVAFALPKNIEKIKGDLARYRISFDCWFPESSLHEKGDVDKAVKRLGELGLTYEKDGAVWYCASRFGAEKDEVLIRANGYPTYFAADIAYHVNKLETRRFDRCIDVWGADHHGHVARIKGAMDAIGIGGDRLDIVLMQLVRLTRGGEPVRMSKRTGNSVTLSDLLDEVPIDAARFFFNMREPGSPLDFDLDLAVEESSKNPVYYVQYAHARICSILKNLAAEGFETIRFDAENFALLTDEAERALIRQLALFPDEIIAAAKQINPAGLTHFTVETATRFHRFYTVCRCKIDDANLMNARLALCVATRHVIRNVLGILKIETPEVM